MKKAIYSIFSVSVLLFASCTEDRGTTTEVAESNNNETVNRSHIQGYGEDGLTRSTTTDADYQTRSQQISQQIATDLQLDDASRQRVSAIMYDRERRLGELENRYNFSETSRMGGQANNDTENDMNNNSNVNADPMRSNNAGNEYAGNSNLNNATGSNMEMNNTAMTSERKTIMADADKELKAVLTPEQYNKFVQNRNNYGGMKSQSNASGNQMKTEGGDMENKSGDQKMKAEGKENNMKKH